MNLRHILMVLSLLAFLSATAGGVLYYSALRQAAFTEAERQAVANTELIHRSLSSLLREHRKTVVTLAGISALQQALLFDHPDSIYHANVVLDHFAGTLDADVCYLMNRQGLTIASSNRKEKDSFVGYNFAFRPYFQQALKGELGGYLALGATSAKRGIYHSYPIYSDPEEQPIGVAVIKSSIERAEKVLGLPEENVVLITDPNGLIFISNRPQWLFRFAWQLPPEKVEQLASLRQFGSGPWEWAGLQKIDDNHITDRQGKRHLMHQAQLKLFPGWRIIHLREMRAISQSVSGPLLRIVGPAIMVLCVLIGISVLTLFHKASREIQRRRSAEDALRQSETRYRSLYHHTPAMLHSIDSTGRLISISDYWAETLGYSRQEVIGRPLTDFFTPETKTFAENNVFPLFFSTGLCKDVPYQFVKKNGQVIETLLSAISERDENGHILRSLAVIMDVTERNCAEEALRLAKEELSRYSKELERQVSIRTSEISAILKYSPSVIYMKDSQGKYLLVNARFEELFGVQNKKARGKTDQDLLPPQVAEQFRGNDEKVLKQRTALNVEEQIPQKDGIHTYLSVKFPIFEESGRILGICGIATDFTTAKKAQERLRRLSASIMANQEKERAAIARELHDELGQLLTALRMDAVWLQERLKKNDIKAAERAGALCALIDTTIEEVRGMAIRLRPGVLDDLGLVDALEWYTTEFERRAQLACIFTHNGIPAVDDTIATAAYRIAQEALTNVARHAKASRAEVDLQMADHVLVLEVSDDGRGFDPLTLPEHQVLGLAGMRERATLVGGSLNIQSNPDNGTLVSLRVPLHPDNGGRLA
jgi:PAS domain S-box-containing protein